MNTQSSDANELQKIILDQLTLFHTVESHLNKFPDFAKEFDDLYVNKDAEKIFDMLVIKGSDLDSVSKITGYSREYLKDFVLSVILVHEAKGKNLSPEETSKWVIRFLRLGRAFLELVKEGKYPKIS